MNRIVYLNGHFSDEKDAKISIFDRSFFSVTPYMRSQQYLMEK